MADKIEQRDFFISFNGVDFAYADAINAALRDAGFTTYFHPVDIPPGGNIPKWMDDALMNAHQMLALVSPEYMAPSATYSEAERYARFWQDTQGKEFKLIPVFLRKADIPPLISVYKRIDATNRNPSQAAAAVVAELKKHQPATEREVLRVVAPLPAIFNVLYRANPNFTGRFAAMESLQASLRAGSNAAITAVAGMGGVGKTTLAAEYCHRFGSQYGGAWWVRAEQESVLLGDLVTLGQRLGLAQTQNIEIDARATLEHLATQKEQWLMVYDNAPNPDAVRKWLPSGEVRCIITSRFVSFDDLAPVTRLDQWTDEVTADYLLARTGRDDKVGALRLAHTLDGLPLAAEQAAVFLRERKGITFDVYSADISRRIREERPAGSKGEYPDTVYAAFVKSLEALESMKEGETALDLVRLCAFLSPDGVDLALLSAKGGRETLPTNFAAAISDAFARENALAALALLSLLRQEGTPSTPVLIFHRLLLEVVREWMGEDACAEYGAAAVQLVDIAFPYDVLDPSNWLICARLMPHIGPLEANAPHDGLPGKALDRLLNQACVYLAVRGDLVGAVELGEKSLSLKRKTRIDDPLTLATALTNLAGCYVDLNRLDDAESAFREALSIEEPRVDPNDSNLAVTLSNLAEVYLKRNEFAKAEPLYLRAAEIMKASWGPQSPQYGSQLGNLDALYDDWAEQSGDTEKRRIAESYSDLALKLTRAARGARHPDTATRYHSLAVLRARLGDWAGAMSRAERAVAIMLSLDLAQHRYTQTRAHFLIRCWKHLGERDKAGRLERGDISDLLPVIAHMEAEHRAWIAENPENRHFGPPSPYE